MGDMPSEVGEVGEVGEGGAVGVGVVGELEFSSSFGPSSLMAWLLNSSMTSNCCFWR